MGGGGLAAGGQFVVGTEVRGVFPERRGAKAQRAPTGSPGRGAVLCSVGHLAFCSVIVLGPPVMFSNP